MLDLTALVMLTVYAAGFLWTARRAGRHLLDDEARRGIRMRGYEPDRPLIKAEDRALSAFFAIMIGLVWPFALIVMAFGSWLKSPVEMAERDRVEGDRRA